MNYDQIGNANLAAQSQAFGLPKQLAKPPSLGESMDNQIKRLADICLRLGTVADSLHGPQPQSASGGATDAGRPVASIASRTRDVAEWIDRIQATLARIENAF